MYTVVYIKPSKTEGYLTLGIDAQGERLRVSVKESVLSELGIHSVPCPLDEETFTEIKTIADRHEALKSALSVLSYADNSRRQLYLKLKRRGFGDELIKGAILECERLGYLNEQRQLASLVCSYAKTKLYGRERIVKALYAKGYPVSSIRRAITELCDAGEVDFDELSERLLSKFGITDSDSEEAHALLYRFGYRN